MRCASDAGSETLTFSISWEHAGQDTESATPGVLEVLEVLAVYEADAGESGAEDCDRSIVALDHEGVLVDGKGQRRSKVRLDGRTADPASRPRLEVVLDVLRQGVEPDVACPTAIDPNDPTRWAGCRTEVPQRGDSKLTPVLACGILHPYALTVEATPDEERQVGESDRGQRDLASCRSGRSWVLGQGVHSVRPSSHDCCEVRLSIREVGFVSVTTAVSVGQPEVLVPGPASAPVPVVHESNNNLDAIDHEGRRYLAWRTSPTHFASTEALLHVVSTGDGQTWRHDHTVQLGRDVREPRFFVHDSSLFLYFFTLGTDWRRFEPDRIHVCRLGDDGWTDPLAISAPDCVVWRVRRLGDRPIMTVYRGAGQLYGRDPVPTTVEFWTTGDGFDWSPVDIDNPTVHVGGTETEVVPHPDRGWIAVTRKEGPAGFGSDIAHLETLESRDWRIKTVPQKLDSPYLFRHGRQVLLVARRTLDFDGAYDLGLPGISDEMRTKIYHRVYWSTPKRTALWSIDPDSLELSHITDLAGKGDSCFPSVIDEGGGRFTVFNYTSPLAGPDLPWIAGQLGPTEIYQVQLDLTEIVPVA